MSKLNIAPKSTNGNAGKTLAMWVVCKMFVPLFDRGFTCAKVTSRPSVNTYTCSSTASQLHTNLTQVSSLHGLTVRIHPYYHTHNTEPCRLSKRHSYFNFLLFNIRSRRFTPSIFNNGESNSRCW